MKKVFLGGSRHIIRLNPAIKKRLDNIIVRDYTILIGDANGADKAVQSYLVEKNYENVAVYCMRNGCRNNLGHWKIRKFESERKQKDFDYYKIKDLEMSKEADWGFMLWDGKSKGTLNNIINLIERNKKTLVYFFPSQEFHNIITFQNLNDLLAECDQDSIALFDKILNVKQRSCLTQAELSFI